MNVEEILRDIEPGEYAPLAMPGKFYAEAPENMPPDERKHWESSRAEIQRRIANHKKKQSRESR